jgi:H+/Cl- antiporter ClcA
MLFLGYLSALLPVVLNILKEQPQKMIIAWYFPGLIGVIIGMVVLQSKKTLPDGKRIAVYDNKSLKQAYIILLLNVLSWIANSIVLYSLSYSLYEANGG